MIKKIVPRLGLILALCVCINSCKTSGLSPTGSVTGKSITAESLSKMPEDAAKVVISAGRLMTGVGISSKIIFEVGVSNALVQGTGIEKGFVMTESRLKSYEMVENSSDQRQIIAILDFENQLGRRCQEEITLNYQIRDSVINVLAGSARSSFDKIPKTVCFVVPADKIPCTEKDLPKTFESMYLRVAKEAVVPGDNRMTDQESNWGMVVFFMDRISSSARFKLAVSASSTGLKGYDKSSKYMDYNGWRVGITAGTFAIKDQNTKDTLFLKAVYTPGKEAGFFKQSVVTGLYALKQ